jgi:excisionase family DNA binding protein
MRADEAQERQLLRVSQLADCLAVSTRVVYGWIATGVIPPEVVVRAGRAIYIKHQALNAWLAGRNGTQPPAST